MTPTQDSTLSLKLAELQKLVEVCFARMEGDLKLLVQQSKQTEKQLDDHEKRIDALERVKWAALGAGVILGGASGGLAQILAR